MSSTPLGSVWRQPGLTFGPGLFKAGLSVCVLACVCGLLWQCVCVCQLQGEAQSLLWEFSDTVCLSLLCVCVCV